MESLILVITLFISEKTMALNNLSKEADSIYCMTNALYKEAEVRVADEDISMVWIAQVVMNRREHSRFPNSVCNVIRQKIKGYCIFSFYCLRGHSYMPDIRRYLIATKVAYRAIQGHYKGVTDVLFFKRCDVDDRWFNRNTVMINRVRNHCFYTYRR